MPNSLVTGGAGFIGSHVAHELVSRGHEVTVLDDLSGGYPDNAPPQAELVTASVTDERQVGAVFDRRRFDYVFHLAAYAAEGLSHFIRRFNYENNVIGSMTVLNAAINNGARCFVFTSSIAVYGSGQVPMAEDMTPAPEDPYGVAKYAVELDLAAARRMFGLDYIVFRPHNVYGEAQNLADRYRNVVGIFMNQVMSGKRMPIFGDGEQTRAFSYIADVAPIIAESVDVPEARNQTFNIGADTPHTVNEIANEIAHAFDVEPQIEHFPPREEVVDAYCSHDRVRAVFGERASVPLSEGVSRMATWARSIGPREASHFGSIEVDKKLPPVWERDA